MMTSATPVSAAIASHRLVQANNARSARHLAARFAAKEAVSKAFGTGIGKAMGWRNIDIRKKPSGEPFLVFSGPAHELALARGVASALVTLSHTEHHAIACVVLEQ